MKKTAKQAKSRTTPEKPATQAGVIAAAKVEKLKNNSTYQNCPKCNRAYKKADTLAKHVKTCQGKQQGTDGNGGAREGAGRPKGSESEKTKELKAIKQGMQMQIAGKVNELVTAQYRMAVGTGRLFVRRKEEYEVGRGKNKTKQERISVHQVLNDDDFMIYLSLKHDEYGRAKDKDTGDEYFYMVAKEGNPVALANMLDRAFGKPKESMDLGNDPDAPLPKHGTGTTAELNKAFMALVKQQIKGGKT